jgi:protein-tyrosine phosphatase
MIVEHYTNRLYQPHGPIPRFWVTPDIMVGGSINDAEDWHHLASDFGIAAVINVETEHSDEGKGIPRLSECRVPDSGEPFPRGLVKHAVSFAKIMVGLGPLYVHCQQGGSRSPAFAYAILRYVFDVKQGEALELVRKSKGAVLEDYGNHPFHRSYLRSIEEALSPT